MPKTRNAFAFRQYYEIGLELIPQSKVEMEQQEFLFLYVINKGIEPAENSSDKLVGLKNRIDFLQNCLRRIKFLQHVTKKHLLRLRKIMEVYKKKFASFIADDLVFSDKRLRCNGLMKEYHMILGSWQGAIDFYEVALQDTLNMLRQNVLWILGAKLKSARKAAGYTMTEIAQYLNVNINTMVKYEKGTVSPPISTVWLLSQKYGVSTDYLMTDYLEK